MSVHVSILLALKITLNLTKQMLLTSVIAHNGIIAHTSICVLNVAAIAPPTAPIRVAPKARVKALSKRKHNYVSPLFTNRGFPDAQNHWESLLPKVKAGRLICKRLHGAPL